MIELMATEEQFEAWFGEKKELTAEVARLTANLNKAKKQLADMRGTPGAMMHGLLETLIALGLNDRLSSVGFSTQLREKLAARDAAQQRAGAVKALREWAISLEAGDPHTGAVSVGEIEDRADAIESGEVAL